MNDKDPIFFLNGPIRKQIRTGACISCVDHIFENNSSMKFCQFCGQSNCEECLYKERMYPRGRINAEGQKPRGSICRLCDRKFLIRQIQLETAMATAKSKQKSSTLESALDETKKEIVLKVNTRDQDRYRNKKTLENIDTEVEEQLLQAKLLKEANFYRDHEKAELGERLHTLHDEQHE